MHKFTDQALMSACSEIWGYARRKGWLCVVYFGVRRTCSRL